MCLPSFIMYRRHFFQIKQYLINLKKLFLKILRDGEKYPSCMYSDGSFIPNFCLVSLSFLVSVFYLGQGINESKYFIYFFILQKIITSNSFGSCHLILIGLESSQHPLFGTIYIFGPKELSNYKNIYGYDKQIQMVP